MAKKKISKRAENPRASGEREEEVGKRIRAHRLSAGMSQEMLAEALGVTFQQVQKYERGTNRVAVSRLMDIATALGRPTSDFIPSTKRSAKEDTLLSLLSTPEGQQLAELFVAIPSITVRRRVVKLVSAISQGE